MLEDFAMEKKLVRLVQSPAVKGTTETKKSLELTTNKTVPRLNKRKEPNFFNGGKFEQSRKYIPQRNKWIDKRSRSRGNDYGGGKEDTKVDDVDNFGVGSFYLNGGKKKQNLNHLLNFHLTPRDGAVQIPMQGRVSAGSNRRMATYKHKYNKEHFLQANCQFVVKSDGDYGVYMSDPDALIDWDHIEQILLQTSEIVSCPICLYPPVAAKMTRCGHVFCWSCVLHYLSLSDKTWRKCPICYEAVHIHDLKSVLVVPHKQFSVGDEITMRLMKREKGSTVAIPVSHLGYPTKKFLSISEKGANSVYSKLLLASSEEVMEIINRERMELGDQLVAEEGCPEVCFIEQAIQLMEIRCSNILGSQQETLQAVPEAKSVQSVAAEIGKDALEYVSAFDNLLISPEVRERNFNSQSELLQTNMEPECKTSFIAADKRKRSESSNSEGIGDEDGKSTISADCLQIGNELGLEPHQVKQYYFYQAADGQHVYLHAVNIHMLEHSYGSLENCPEFVIGKIVEKESGSMTEDLRRKLRYLQHLPVTCPFEVAEIQLKTPIITAKTLELFRDQLEVRKKRRSRREREERKREKKINEEEAKRWGKFPSHNIDIDSDKQFPQYTDDYESAGACMPESPILDSFGSSPAQSTSSISSEAITSDPFKAEAAVSDHEYSGPSFAQMLRGNSSKKNEVNPMSFSEKLKSKKEFPSRVTTECEDPNSYGNAPTYQQSFSDAIARALEKAVINEERSEDAASTKTTQPSGKKKKRQKQKILFATSMACSSK